MSKILTPPWFKRYGADIGKDYNEIRPEDSHDTRKAKMEAWIAKRVGEKVAQKYPNREWKVIVDIPNEMLILACDSVSNVKGYHIKMVGYTIKQLQKKAVYAAGEILERHNITRNRIFDEDILETLDRDFMDSVITPDSAAEPI